MKKQTIIRLEAGDLSQEFDISHAERLLDMGPVANGGWHIPEDSPYKYSQENGIELKSDKGNSAKAEKAANNS